MELQIYSPSEDGFIKEISWNHEEIKKELAERVKFYTGMVYTEDQIKNAKADRAKLRKFVDVLEIKRKEIKKQCLAPYETFEKQMKELVSIVNEPIMVIDGQVKEYEDGERAKKLEKIKEYFNSLPAIVGFDTLSIGHIFDPKWLNLSVNLNAVIKEIDEKLEQIEKDLATLKNLPEFAFEAIEAYKDTLDINQAIEQGKRLAEIQKRKEEQQQKMNEAFERMGTNAKVVAEGIANLVDAAKEAQTEKSWVSFSALLSTEDALALRVFFSSRNIEFKAIRG